MHSNYFDYLNEFPLVKGIQDVSPEGLIEMPVDLKDNEDERDVIEKTVEFHSELNFNFAGRHDA